MLKLEDSSIVLPKCCKKKSISICLLKQISPSCSRIRFSLNRFENFPVCTCGEIETVAQIMMQCHNYENAREQLRQMLLLGYGITG